MVLCGLGKKINAGQGRTPLAVVEQMLTAPCYPAEFPGRVDALGSFSLHRSEEKTVYLPLSGPMGH